MKIRKEIQIHSKSHKYIHEDYFKGRIDEDPKYGYKLITNYNSKIINKCIIHLYSKSDTFNIEGESIGYVDSLLFDAVIYDCKKMEMFILKNRDGICLDRIDVTVKIFKDMSTLLQFKEPIYINVFGQCFDIEKVYNTEVYDYE